MSLSGFVEGVGDFFGGIGDAVSGFFGGGGGGGGKNSDLLSGIGSLVGLAFGGPSGAAIGAGLGTLIGGGSIGQAFQTGAGSFVAGKLGGEGGSLMHALQGGGGPGDVLRNAMPSFGPQGDQQGGPQGGPRGGPKQGMPGILGALDNPLVIAALLKATEPKNVSITSPEQQRQLQTGERLPDYSGTPAYDYRYAKGGVVQGPGTGRSDSIPAKIYQNGRPVQEARLSDGEFVMTNRAVRGAGNGDRARGAAEMYRLMHQFERRA